MKWTAKYIEDSLYYEDWKTKFIEKFCLGFARLQIELKKYSYQQIPFSQNFVLNYNILYKLMLNILKRKLKSEGFSLKLYQDVIYNAYINKLISDKKMFFEVLKFYQNCALYKNYYKNFKEEYITIMKDFSLKFKLYTQSQGTKDKNYVFCDNSYCLWNLKKKYYVKLINLFLEFENLKIVRIFGSRVTKNCNDFSDLDFICEGTYTKEEFIKMQNKILKCNIPYIIDIYDIFSSNKAFIYRNLIRSNIFYAREDFINDDYISILNQG